jgi:hypothetical protein
MLSMRLRVPSQGWKRMEVEGVVWKLINDAAVSGHRVADLATEHVTTYTRLSLLDLKIYG